MIRYEVTLDVPPELAEAVAAWMRRDHIPAILATGCFVRIHFDHSPGALRTVYVATDRAALDHYFQDHQTRFRAEFTARFPTGVAATRAVWEEVEEWPTSS